MGGCNTAGAILYIAFFLLSNRTLWRSFNINIIVTFIKFLDRVIIWTGPWNYENKLRPNFVFFILKTSP